MGNNNDYIYDETDSVKYIMNYLPQELKGKFSSDDILYIVDLIYEYYETKGMLDEGKGDDEVFEFDEDELTNFVVKNALKDNVGKFLPEEIEFVVKGELGYCESIHIFD